MSSRLLSEVIRDEMVMHAPIGAILGEGPVTIPEIAERLGSPSHEVMFWVMAMRRYGMIGEAGKPGADGYVAYTLTTTAAEEESA